MPDAPILEAAPLPATAVEVGRIADPWGVKGWFKVVPYSSEPQALFNATTWFLQPATQGAKSFFSGTLQLLLREVRPHGDCLVAHAQQVENREAAQALRGARIFIDRAHFPATQKDEYYWVDLIGLAVINRQGVPLGTVRQLLPAGPQTTLVLEWQEHGKARERLIPFVSAFVDKVDLAARCITVDWQAEYD